MVNRFRIPVLNSLLFISLFIWGLFCCQICLADETDALTTTDTMQPLISDKTQDPLEKVNRDMFKFNETLDDAILKPVATFYLKVVPKPLTKGIHNVFMNLENLAYIPNDILQLRFYQFLNDAWRLVINTTFGIGGLFDAAACIKLERTQNDFGMTLARWGWRNSTYIVWPFFGPSTLRDGIGRSVDYFYFSIYPFIDSRYTRYEVYGLSVVDWRAQTLQFQEVMEEAAYDKYTFVRNAYLQRRQSLITKMSS